MLNCCTGREGTQEIPYMRWPWRTQWLEEKGGLRETPPPQCRSTMSQRAEIRRNSETVLAENVSSVQESKHAKIKGKSNDYYEIPGGADLVTRGAGFSGPLRGSSRPLFYPVW